ncbi:hypothetical protein FACS189496_2720 [Bacilli bacterium]|nr:hypothetical protein FACS189496_2720 [Bacilli bacterium]
MEQNFDTQKNEPVPAYSIKAIIPKFLENFNVLFWDSEGSKNKKPGGLASGFYALDMMAGGLNQSELIIIGGSAGIGKTSFALSMLENISVQRHISAAYFSLQMSRLQLTERLISSVSGFDPAKIRSGLMQYKDLHKIYEAADKLYKSPLAIVDADPIIFLDDIISLAQELREKEKIDIIFIDEMSFIGLPDADSLNQDEKIVKIVQSLKELAMELNIPVVVTTTLDQPELGRLHPLEKAADLILWIDREPPNLMAAIYPSNVVTRFTLLKNKHGPKGIFYALFYPPNTKFGNI